MKNLILVLVVVGLLFSIAGIAWGRETASGYQLPWDAYASGGEKMESARYKMDSTAGQALVGGASSESYRIGAGFWTVMAEAFIEIFMPIISR